MTPAATVDEIDYLEESGPGIPELPDGPVRDELPAGEVLPPQYPGWQQESVETFLKGTGYGIHMMIGQSEDDWKMTAADLERIAPPLTRICNRWEPALKLSPYADPLLVAHGFWLWGWRSALERQRAVRDRNAGQKPAATERYERTGADADVDVGQAAEEELADVELEDIETSLYFDNGREPNE
jgi:hypothetical protein